MEKNKNKSLRGTNEAQVSAPETVMNPEEQATSTGKEVREGPKNQKKSDNALGCTDEGDSPDGNGLRREISKLNSTWTKESHVQEEVTLGHKLNLEKKEMGRN